MISNPPPLNEYELDILISRCPQDLLGYMKRLLSELRELKDRASESEFMYSQEVER